jgi:hypothetical protein
VKGGQQDMLSSQESNSAFADSDLIHFQERIKPVVSKCLIYGALFIPLFSFTILIMYFISLLPAGDGLIVVSSTAAISGLAIYKDNKYKNENSQQDEQLEFIKERIAGSGYIHEDIKGDYLEKVSASPSEASRFFAAFVQQEERMKEIMHEEL